MKINISGFVMAFKPQAVRVGMSSTFPIRSKCRFCMKGPTHYFCQRLPPRWFSPKRIQEMANHAYKHINRMCQDFYFIETPKEFTGTMAFNWQHAGKSYDPSLHTKRGAVFFDNVLEYLSCNCGRTCWSFAQKIAILRDEIVRRKARYKYPQKFEDYF